MSGDWEYKASWGAVRVGDRVGLKNAVATADGTVAYVGQERWNDIAWKIILSGVGVEFRSDQWELAIWREAIVLPTEPGIYTDFSGDAWLLHKDGRWVCLMDAGELIEVTISESVDAVNYVPFTRLEPVGETATRLMKELLEVSVSNDGGHVDPTMTIWATDWHAIGNMFGARR